MPHACLTGGEKVVATGRCVQLIVFFGAIREILKKEIYRMDKQNFGRDENKSRVPGLTKRKVVSCKYERFGL
jgi:hypothetical protein